MTDLEKAEQRVDERLSLIRSAISDYVELFHRQQDVEEAIKDDMRALGYHYSLRWILQPAANNKDVYKLQVVVQIDGAFYYMDFYYWD